MTQELHNWLLETYGGYSFDSFRNEISVFDGRIIVKDQPGMDQASFLNEIRKNDLKKHKSELEGLPVRESLLRNSIARLEEEIYAYENLSSSQRSK